MDLNSIGLVLDIIGFIILYIFGLPPRNYIVDDDGYFNDRTCRVMSFIGSSLIIVGFVFQFIYSFDFTIFCK